MSGIIPVVPLTGVISGNANLSGSLTPEGQMLTGQISSDLLSAKKYTGPYEVTPRKIDQTLDTADKLLTDDVTVFAINYSEVDNLSGGKTVNIGYE